MADNSRFTSNLGKRLGILREIIGWTLREAGDHFHVTGPHIQKIEKGKSLPSLPLFTRLVEQYKIPYEELVSDEWTEADEIREKFASFVRIREILSGTVTSYRKIRDVEIMNEIMASEKEKTNDLESREDSATGDKPAANE